MPRDWVGCDELEFRYAEIAVRPENVGTTILSIFRELFRRRTDAVVVGIVVVVVVVAGRRKFNRFTKKIVGHWLGMLSGGRLANCLSSASGAHCMRHDWQLASTPQPYLSH